METKLSTQLELVTAKEARILALDIGFTKAEKNLRELNAKHKEQHAEHISQSNYILEQQTTIAKGVEESSRLQRDLKKVQDTLASIEQSSAKKDEKILHLRSQLSESKYLTRTQRGIIDVSESNKNKLREQISTLEANVAKLETDKKHLKAQERKKATEYFQSQFQTHLAADRARTKEGTLWHTMSAVFTAYSDMEWSKIVPFLAPDTPIAPFIPSLKAQFNALSGKGTGSSAPSASTTPPPSKS